MNTSSFKPWLGRSLAIAIVLVSGQSAIATTPTVTDSISSHLMTVETIAMEDSLELGTWQLLSYRSDAGATIEAFGERPATFQFQDGRVSGTTGCNRFFSAYTREGNTLEIAAGGSTLMACFPEALAEQETAILSGLPQVTNFAIADQQLTLSDSTGTTLFTLVPQPTASLTQTEWVLAVYNNGRGGLTTPLADTTITATFAPETGLVGSAGCNTYRASYEVDHNGLTIGPAASTRRLCAQPDGIMQQETAFLGLLQDVATYSLEGNQLELKNAEGTTLARFTTTM